MKKYLKITYGNSLCLELSEANDFIENMDIDSLHKFQVVEMTEEEFNNLPEFRGF